MGGLLKFGVKVGILGGTIYYTREIGVWSDSAKTYEIAQDVSRFVEPHFRSAFNELQTQYPSVQELPTVADMNRSAVLCWNKGVIKSVDFLTSLPCTLTKYSSDGVAYVTKQLQQGNSSPSADKKSSGNS